MMIGLIIAGYVVLWTVSSVLMLAISRGHPWFFEEINSYEDLGCAAILGMLWPITDLVFLVTLALGMASHYIEFKTLRRPGAS
jgi:hypothetical protein